METLKSYNRLQMEYPELGWTRIQELREKLGTEDRKLVESLLDKIEILYWELEQAKYFSKIFIQTPDPTPAVQFQFGHQMVGKCKCEDCLPSAAF